MGTVDIPAAGGGSTYTIYGTVAGLTEYAGGSLSWYATWAAASVDNRARAQVEAAKLLDRQSWDGSVTSDGQAQAWPRDGVTGIDPSTGEAPDDGSTPTSIVSASYELALAMLADVSVVAGTSTTSNVQSAQAGGGVGVSFFGPQKGGRFPARVMELIGWALGGAVSGDGACGVYVGGADGASQFDPCDEYGLSGPG